LIWLPADDVAEGVVRLQQVDGDTFRRVRDDGELPGEPWYFVRDAADNVIALATHALRLPKLK